MWALEMDQFNEWMTEEDYEVDESGKKKVHKVSADIGRKRFPFGFLNLGLFFSASFVRR